MFPTARYDQRAGRYVPYTDYLEIEGYDFTGATVKAQVRDRKNGGQVRADLAQVTTAAAEGIRIDDVVVTEGVPTTRIAWRVNETTMEAMPETDPGADVELWFDIHLTPIGELKFVLLGGRFLVEAGVTS